MNNRLALTDDLKLREGPKNGRKHVYVEINMFEVIICISLVEPALSLFRLCLREGLDIPRGLPTIFDTNRLQNASHHVGWSQVCHSLWRNRSVSG